MKQRTEIEFIDELLAVSLELIKSFRFQKVLIGQMRDLSKRIKGLNRLIETDLIKQDEKKDSLITEWEKYRSDLETEKEKLK